MWTDNEAKVMVGKGLGERKESLKRAHLSLCDNQVCRLAKIYSGVHENDFLAPGKQKVFHNYLITSFM